MNYKESLEYIHSLLRFGIKPGLERVSALLRAMGEPQKKCAFIHVAGTNGKGSTSTMLAAMLRSSGRKTGLYTSPFVSDFRERIQVNGHFIPEAELCRLVEEVKSVARKENLEPTEFEFITALAFAHFAEEGCEAVVLETGLGGRFDATNVIEAPLVSVITPIGLDHTAILGDTVEQIAAEKGGIIKAGCPSVVASGQPAGAKKVLAEIAAERKSDIRFCDSAEIMNSGIEGSVFKYNNKEYRVGMMGEYQVQNAVTAIEAARLIPELLNEEDIEKGIAEAFIPARMERISLEPLTLLDGGHNGHAAIALKKVLAHLPRKPIAVVGMMEDKDIADYAECLAQCFERIITVKVEDNPRAISAERLADIFAEFNPNVAAAKDYSSALNMAEVGKRDVMVCGSLYLAGGIRPLLFDILR